MFMVTDCPAIPPEEEMIVGGELVGEYQPISCRGAFVLGGIASVLSTLVPGVVKMPAILASLFPSPLFYFFLSSPI